jgi:hypothetical protein
MARGVDQRTGAPLAPAPHCCNAPAPIRNRKRPVADSRAVRNTMGWRVSTSLQEARGRSRQRASLTKNAGDSDAATRERGTVTRSPHATGPSSADRGRAVRHRPRARAPTADDGIAPRATRLGVTVTTKADASRSRAVALGPPRSPVLSGLLRDGTRRTTERRHRLVRFRGRSRLHARHDHTWSFPLHVLAG